MKKLLMSLLLIFCIGCTFTLLNETNINISIKSTKETIMIEAGFISDDSDLYDLKNHTDNIATAIAVCIKKSLNE